MMDARFLILDEPTAVLSPQEKIAFFGVLKGLAADGIGVVVVTHHISEALQHSERVTILRAGNVVGDARKPSKELTKEAVTQMMVGQVSFAPPPRDGGGLGDVVVKVTDLSGQLESKRLENVNLSVRAGEVLGIAGVEGDGQRELAAALTGAWTPETGTVELEGRKLRDYTAAERTRMVADVPDDQLLGTIAEISVWENIGLTRLAWQESPTPWRCKEVRVVAKEHVKEFGIRTASLNSPVGLLSGGNRRRVVIARELSKQPTLAVLTFATKGLDVRSVAQVQEWTRRLASGGTAVIYISADLEEVLTISDRIAVLAHGEIRGILDADEATVERIGHLMLGASSESVTA
jgi:general nucleoside transport system ATP-binding protein